MVDFNRLMVWLLKTPLHRLISNSVLSMHIVGTKSGRVYEVPVNYVIVNEAGGTRYLITSQQDRTWWRNLRKRVKITVQVKGQAKVAYAQAFEDHQDVMAGLKAYFQHSPRSARYFGLALNADGVVPDDELARIVQERVVIWIDLE